MGACASSSRQRPPPRSPTKRAAATPRSPTRTRPAALAAAGTASGRDRSASRATALSSPPHSPVDATRRREASQDGNPRAAAAAPPRPRSGLDRASRGMSWRAAAPAKSPRCVAAAAAELEQKAELVLHLAEAPAAWPTTASIPAAHLHERTIIILCLFDTAESTTIAHWNAAAERATGLSASQAVGRQLRQLLAPFAEGQTKRTAEVASQASSVCHHKHGPGRILEIGGEGSFHVQYETIDESGKDKHRYKPKDGDRTMKKFKLPRREMAERRRFSFGSPGTGAVGMTHLSLAVMPTSSVGFAALVGDVEEIANFDKWALQSVRAAFQVSASHEDVRHILTCPPVDSSQWGPLDVRMMLKKVYSSSFPAEGQPGYGIEIAPPHVQDVVPREISTGRPRAGESVAPLTGAVEYLLQGAVRAAKARVSVSCGVDRLASLDDSMLSGRYSAAAGSASAADAQPGAFLRFTVSDDRPGGAPPAAELAVLRSAAEGPSPPGSPVSSGRALKEHRAAVRAVGGRIEHCKALPGSALEASGASPAPPSPQGAGRCHMCVVVPLIAPPAGDHGDEARAAASLKKSRQINIAAPAALSPPLRVALIESCDLTKMQMCMRLWQHHCYVAVFDHLPAPEGDKIERQASAELGRSGSSVIVSTGDAQFEELRTSELVIIRRPTDDAARAALALVMEPRPADTPGAPQKPGPKVLLLLDGTLCDGQRVAEACEELRKEISGTGCLVSSVPPTEDFDVQLAAAAEQVENGRRRRRHEKELRDAFSHGKGKREIKQGRMLGRGAFGAVYEATEMRTGGKMAMKILQVPNEDQLLNLLREIEVLAKLQDPNIAGYFFSERHKEQQELRIYMELCTDGNLSGKIPKDKGLPPAKAAHYLCGILAGLQYLHNCSPSIVHRDMKPDNVLLSDGTCKLTDFGTATMRSDPRTLADFRAGMDVSHDVRGPGKVLGVADEKVRVEFAEGEIHSYNKNSVQQGKLQPLAHAQKQGKKTVEGTQRYMAPEVMNYPDNDPDFLNAAIASSSVDVWATGCIAMEMCTGKPPFVHRGEGMMAVLYVARLSLKKGDTADIGAHDYEATLLGFIRAALHVDPRKRPRCATFTQSSSALQQLAHRYEPAEEEAEQAAEVEAKAGASQPSSESESVCSDW